MDINRDTLKEYFERGDRPTEEQFVDLVDSLINKEDDQVYVDGSKLHENAQIGLGAHRDANDPPVGDLELVRLYVDKRVSLNQLKIRGGAGSNAPGNGKLLFAKDNTGNTEWRNQTQLDQNHWKRVDFANPNSVMYAVPTGNIGIGTDTPTSRLTISGTPPSVEKGLGLHIHNTRPAGNVQYTKASVSLLVQSGQSTTYRWEMASERQSPTASAFKLRRFTDGTDTTVSETYLSIGSDGNHVAFDTPGKFSFSRGNVGIGTISPTAKLHVAGDTTIAGLTKTQSLNIFPLPNGGDPAGDVLTIDNTTGLVKKVAVGSLQTAGYNLWYLQGSNIHSKIGSDVYIDKNLLVASETTTKTLKITNSPDVFTFTKTLGIDANGGVVKSDSIWNRDQYGNIHSPNGKVVCAGGLLFADHNLEVNGEVKVNGEYPFLIQKFKLTKMDGTGPSANPNRDRLSGVNTRISCSEYHAAVIIGYFADFWHPGLAIGGAGRPFMMITQKHTFPNQPESWVIYANVPNADGGDESDYIVHVMFIRKGLVKNEGSNSVNDSSYPINW
jgi:hypothetical protein